MGLGSEGKRTRRQSRGSRGGAEGRVGVGVGVDSRAWWGHGPHAAESKVTSRVIRA